MQTHMGVSAFVGLALGPIIGYFLPYPSTFEALTGLALGLLVGFGLDRMAARKRAKADTAD